MVQYYTLQEAAAKLRVSADTLKEMAKNGEVRAFQDRGSLRFRAQEVDELARLRGQNSEPDLQLGDAPPAAGESRVARPSPAPAPKPTPSPQPKSDPSVFDFTLGTEDSDEVSLGQDLTPSSSKDMGRRSPPAGKSNPPKPGAPKSPPPRPGSGAKSPPPSASASDSDVRLVSDGTGLDFQVDLDRGSQVEKEPPSSHRGGGSSKKGKTKPDQPDSGVRIVPLDQASDSDVKMVPDPASSSTGSGSRAKRGNNPSDSDIRLDSGAGSRSRDDALVTEEIDLDAESRKAEETEGSKVGKPGAKPKRTQIGGAGASPFELSGPEQTSISPPGSKSGKSGVRPAAKKEIDTSSEFELMTPADPRPSTPKSSVVKTPGSSSAKGSKPPAKAPPPEDVPVLMGDEDVNLGELTGAGGGSGINLKDPADSGISLEQGGSDEMEFELSLDSGASAPKTPAPIEKESSSSNEFELSLDEGSSSDSDSESEFELSLDVPEGSSVKVEEPASGGSDSDSEFELTLDEAGGLAPVEESEGLTDDSDENKDIFETDFEVPALDEGSGSEAVALEESETGSSSDFDLDINEDATSEGSNTGSQVVALDDGGEADEGAETVAKPRRKAAALAAGGAAALEGEEDEGTLDEDLESDLGEEPETEAETVYLPAPAAEWGVLPSVFLIPAVLVLFIASLMTFELVQGMWSFHRGGGVSGPVSNAIASMFDKVPASK
jgi:excisionase family DNA binding protein